MNEREKEDAIRTRQLEEAEKEKLTVRAMQDAQITIQRLEQENAVLRTRVARLENLAKVVENYLEGDSDAEYLYVALKALEAGGEGGE